MSNVIVFKPKSERDYSSNLDDFITFARHSLSNFTDKKDWSWERNAWIEVGSFVKHGHRVTYKNEHKQDESVWLTQPFRNFAKAYVRYHAITISDTTANLAALFMPLRALEAALMQVHKTSDITKLDIIVLDRAAELIREYTNSGTARYDHGRRLKELASFISDKQFCKKITWQSPFPAIKRSNSRLDKSSKNKSARKLPSQAALDALAEMFANNPQSVSDKITLAYCGLLLCAPSRISELKDLNKYCIHEDTDSNGEKQLGLRWHPKKRGKAGVKYVPSAMQNIARESVVRLTEACNEARKLAKWLEETNGKFYRPKEYRKIPTDKPLTKSQILNLFNSEWDSMANYGIKGISRILIRDRHKANAIHERIVAKGSITFTDLDDLSRSLLSEDFPYINKSLNLKYSDALVVIRFGELDSKATRPYQLAESDIGQLIGLRITGTAQMKSIFEKHGYAEPNGTQIKVTSHQFRHWLNTLAQKGNVGQIDIAKWSGRANVHQNSVYNHMTHQDYIDDLKSSGLQVASNIVPLAKIKAKDPNQPVTLADLDAATTNNDKVAHVTEWGFCVHDFAMSPCQSCADCLNCNEQVCVKGDNEKLNRLKRQRQLLIGQLDKAIGAVEEDVFNADRWVEHQRQTIDRISGLIDLLESNEVAEGAVIRLSNEYQDSPIRRELGGKVNKDINPPASVSLEEMRKLLEGK